MEELRKFQSSTFDTLARRKLIEDQNTIMELSDRLQELQNEVNCMNDSKDFQDAESVRSGNSHVTNQPMLFPKHPIPEGMLRPSFVSPPAKKGRQAFGIHMVYRETFFQIHQLLLHHPIQEDSILGFQTSRKTSPHVTTDVRFTVNPRFQSGPSAGNSFDPKEGIF